jgi:hypothetical protein
MIINVPQYRSHIIIGVVCLLLGIGIGLAIGWKLYKPTQIIETAQPEQVLEEIGVTVLQRLPETEAPPPPKPLQKAAKKVGGKLERTAHIVIQPEPTEDSPPDCKCKEVKVDVGVVDQGNGKRIIAYAEDGTILAGRDIPLEPYTAVKETKWEVGLVVPVENPQGIGGYVSRKVGPFSVGLQIAKPFPDDNYTAMATVGLRF